MARCINCSAPLSHSTPVCDYCGSHNEVDLINTIPYSISSIHTNRKCPSCKASLPSINIGKTKSLCIEQCNTCYGLFFDRGELESILADSISDVFTIDFLKLQALAENSTIGLERIVYRPCPVCEALMTRINFGTKSGVIIDQCSAHGVWLDGGELRRLLTWRKAGGELLHEQIMREKEQARIIEMQKTQSANPFSSMPFAGGELRHSPPVSPLDIASRILTKLLGF